MVFIRFRQKCIFVTWVVWITLCESFSHYNTINSHKVLFHTHIFKGFEYFCKPHTCNYIVKIVIILIVLLFYTTLLICRRVGFMLNLLEFLHVFPYICVHMEGLKMMIFALAYSFSFSHLPHRKQSHIKLSYKNVILHTRSPCQPFF